jgi:hypothetical protein
MRGTLLGINAGAYVRTANVLIGGLLAYESADFSEACDQIGHCDYLKDRPPIGPQQSLSVSGSVLF